MTGGCHFSNHSNLFLTTSSPSNTYKVELSGNPHTPSIFSAEVENETRFSIFKKDQLIVTNEYLDRYDYLDSGFADMYPENKWINESVLRFGKDIENSERRTDILFVSNKTNKEITYLKIISDDLLLIFDMPPNSKLKLKVPHQNYNSWVWSYGKFANGQSMKGNGANFYHKDKINKPLRYCVSVEENQIKVESPIMDGFLDSNSDEKPDRPMNKDCDM